MKLFIIEELQCVWQSRKTMMMDLMVVVFVVCVIKVLNQFYQLHLPPSPLLLRTCIINSYSSS
jgi:hypothetical protein